MVPQSIEPVVLEDNGPVPESGPGAPYSSSMPMLYATDVFKSEIVSEQIVAIICVGEVGQHLRACGTGKQARGKFVSNSRVRLSALRIL
jgi:hypothetical protein